MAKWVYSNYRIAFDGASWWTSGDDFDRNVVIFVLIIVHHFTQAIAKIFFLFKVKKILLEILLETLNQRKRLVSILVKQIQIFTWVFMTIFNSKFKQLIYSIVQQIYYFLIFHKYIIILILQHQQFAVSFQRYISLFRYFFHPQNFLFLNYFWGSFL